MCCRLYPISVSELVHFDFTLFQFYDALPFDLTLFQFYDVYTVLQFVLLGCNGMDFKANILTSWPTKSMRPTWA